MSIALIYNFSEHPGGGDLVMLDIVEALVERNYNVTLYTSHPHGLQQSLAIFDKDENLVEKVDVIHIDVPRVRHPYNIYIIAKRIAGSNLVKEHDLFIVSDDIPKPIANTNTLVYVHYPHVARILLGELVPYKYRCSFRGKLLWKLHSTLFARCFLMNWHRENIYVVVNSTLTEHHVKKALNPLNIVKIYPPVQVERIKKFVESKKLPKENLVIYVGRIQPEKGIEDLVRALPLIKNIDVAVKIVGFNYDTKYLRYLRNLARDLGVSKHVEISPNASREEVLQTLAKAKILVHSAYYEPFGIAVVEGMAAGCIPVVRKGFNGPWIDIVENGRYGYGFNNLHELAKSICEALNSGNKLVNIVTARANAFDEQKFKHYFAEYLRSIC